LNGERKLEIGNWRMENENWRLVNREWKLENRQNIENKALTFQDFSFSMLLK
jgi:hypothetical protein